MYICVLGHNVKCVTVGQMDKGLKSTATQHTLILLFLCLFFMLKASLYF